MTKENGMKSPWDVRREGRGDIFLRRTRNMKRIRNIMIHPAIFPWMVEEGPEPEDFFPIEDDRIHYVEVLKRGNSGRKETVGLFLLVPQTSRCMEGHAGMLPAGRGRIACKALGLIKEYAFAGPEPLAEKLVSRICVENTNAIRYNVEVGRFKVEGVNRASLVRGGRLVDQIWTGLTRAEWEMEART